ncbi:hypothetical protein KIH87_04685 [Paraneptunicella aestuarii]|uniref:hypothetical protein n=1 Tax=Paraneptunicella aestuarii TaxID=2831148 RepID=UPI001E529BF7|nr:hypothetical protein [Paraneptunicella aestuarii]UAA39657.1 hypothetical protein KIH87_04685 [Paraneptunicella aestuarii]
MLSVNKKEQGILLFLGIILLIEFWHNVWVDDFSNKKNLNVESWQKVTLSIGAQSQLHPLNEIFGLKPEPDPEELKRLAEAERLAQEKRELEESRIDTLTLGEKDVRLLGISQSHNGKAAILSITSSTKVGEIFTILLNDSIDVVEGKMSILLKDVYPDSVKLIVSDGNGTQQSEFNLVIFNYDI